jgi:tripartite-type tricarboxylate transporter receptor subunit TctC
MKLPRRNFLHLAAGAAALPALSRIAWARAYPARPVRMIVPFAPSGGTDIFARLIGQWLSDRYGQPFVIENRPGANGNVGTEAALRASADGYRLLMIDASPAINATLYNRLNFNFVRDASPVAAALPNVPSIGEFVSGYEATTWYGVTSEINAGLAEPKLKARFAELGVEVFPGSPADFGRHIADETEKWAKVIRAANIKPE